MAEAAEPDLTRDGFLSGRLTIWQPRSGYRAGIDPVLLAASLSPKEGARVLELGTGVGTAALCLAVRRPDLDITALERQSAYADLARRNARDNGREVGIVEGDLARMPAQLRQQSFDHVFFNPPYWDASARTWARDPGREAALAEATPLAIWCDAALRRTRPGGQITLIHAAERLPDALSAFGNRLGQITVLPLASRAGRPAGRVLITGRKGGRAPFCLLPPLVLHDGDRHGTDGDDYAPVIRAVLRDGAPLPWGAR